MRFSLPPLATRAKRTSTFAARESLKRTALPLTRRPEMRGAAAAGFLSGTTTAGAAMSTSVDAVAECPSASLTVTVAVCLPGEVNAWETEAPSADVPSSKLHFTDAVPGPGMQEPSEE